MDKLLLGASAVCLAYLVGSIPTAYLLVRALCGIDIRTVGSGNVGATNAGRVLGAGGFLAVFVLDLIKGLLPTWLLPWYYERSTGSDGTNLAVFVAVAAILGHSFPIWLGLKGGKGVSTSLGTVLALDLIAALSAVGLFALVLIATRIVSLSSLLGATIFLVVHFARTPQPFSNDQLLMSVAIIGLYILMIARHRSNLIRIAAGVEPRITIRRKPRTGRARIALVSMLALLAAAAAWGLARMRAACEIDAGQFRAVFRQRVQTGHQRAERMVFLNDGKALAVTCPRYDRLMIYEVDANALLVLKRDLKLEGKPVDLETRDERLFVLQRPSGDARHLVPGFWQCYTRAGVRLGPRVEVGYDPDDLCFLPDGRALVLLSGNAEGETNRHDPALAVFEFDSEGAARELSRLRLGDSSLDPTRLQLSMLGSHVGIATRAGELIGVSLAEEVGPSITGKIPLVTLQSPRLSRSEEDLMLLPPTTLADAVLLGDPEAEAAVPQLCDVLAWIDRRTDEVVFTQLGRAACLARFAPAGPFGQGKVRATGLAYHARSRLMAVADRSGGVHLMTLEPADEPNSPIAAARSLR